MLSWQLRQFKASLRYYMVSHIKDKSQIGRGVDYSLGAAETIQLISFIDLNQISHMPTIPNHLSPFLAIILLLCAALPTHALRLHAASPQDPKVYDEDAYLTSLARTQEKLADDVKAIQTKFKDINLRLKETNISDSQKLIFLQESMANERDSLFNVQTYLNVPFALRACQCLNLTHQQKNQLTAQIQDVQASINTLESALDGPYANPKCPEGQCEVVQTIQAEIEQMRNYVKIMQDTATSECCKVINYVYRDNLESDNWVYGTTNEQDYKLSLFNQSKGVNLTQCPANKPAADLTTNQCYACPPSTPLFNLGTRSCQLSCQSQSLIYVSSTHQCDYNRNCQQGLYFDNNTHKCEVNLGTDSTCPRDRPVWNSKTYSCNKCDKSVQYFDTNVYACRACTANQVWQEYTEECLNKAIITEQCKSTQYFDKDSRSCINIPPAKPGSTTGAGTKVGSGAGATNPTKNPNQGTKNPSATTPSSGTYSQCPPSTPFWSTSDLACYKCPDSTPSYNSITNKCEQCPNHTVWSTTTRRCEKQPIECPTGQTYNPTTERCDTAITCESNQLYNSATGKCESFSPTGQIGLCPPETPFWNAKALYCEKCGEDTPFWNKTANACQSCPKNTAWDMNKQICKSTLKQCPPGQVLNLTTNNCEAVKCSSSTPIFNYATSKCEACPEGTKFNNATSICESLSPQRTNTSACSPETPYWNPQKLFCEACPAGQTLDSAGKCQPTTSHTATSQIHMLILDNHDLPEYTHEIKKAHSLEIGRLSHYNHLQD